MSVAQAEGSTDEVAQSARSMLDTAGIELPSDIVVLQATPGFRAAIQGDAALMPGGVVRSD